MSFIAHFRFGYLIKIASLFTLGLVNIALPNWLGVTAFASLSETMAFVGITSLIFSEGVSFLIIRHVLESGVSIENGGQVLSQAIYEHFMLAGIGLTGVFGMTYALNPIHHYTMAEWLLVWVTALIVSAYIPSVAFLIAMMRNHVVLGLAIINGVLSFVWPVLLHHFGIDVRFSIMLTYGFCLALIFVYFLFHGMRGFSKRIDLKNRILMKLSLLPLIAPTALRLAIIWIPVILFANAGNAVNAATYKIATSIAIGALAFVPFHKQTMVSIEGDAPIGFAKTIALAAILMAGLGGVLLIGIAEPLTNILYVADYSRLAEYLPALGPFLVLQTIVDIALVELILKKKDKLILSICLTTALIATISLVFIEPRWYPALCTGLFFVLFALVNPQFFSGQPILRGITTSLIAVSTAHFIAGGLGLLVGLGVLALALALDSGLRECITRAVLHFASAHKTR